VGDAGGKEKDDLCMSSPLIRLPHAHSSSRHRQARVPARRHRRHRRHRGFAPARSLARPGRAASAPTEALQLGSGPIHGDHSLPSTADDVRWGYVPAIGATPSLRIGSGETVTIDTVSHEGILEDRGRDPVAYFGGHQVAENDVLTDAIAIVPIAAPRAGPR
jgi:hypothetical protein